MSDDDYVRDVRGKIICVGSTVVVAGPYFRLREEIVERVEPSRASNAPWRVRFRSGGWTTTDRVAVVR